MGCCGWGLVEKGDGDVAFGVGGIVVAGHPEVGVVDAFAGFIEDDEHLSGGGVAFEVAELALADERPAGLAVPDEFHDVNAAAGELLEIEVAAGAAEGGVGVLDGTFFISDQPVEIDVGVDFAAGGFVEIGGVDLVDLDDEGLDVLDVDVEGDGVVGIKVVLVGEGEIDVHAFFHRLQAGGGNEGGVLVLVAVAGGELGFDEGFGEIV